MRARVRARMREMSRSLAEDKTFSGVQYEGKHGAKAKASKGLELMVKKRGAKDVSRRLWGLGVLGNIATGIRLRLVVMSGK